MPEHDLLAHPLGAAHHGMACDSLVGRDQHEALNPGRLGAAQRVPCPHHVGLHRLNGVGLEHRHVLVSGAVEDYVRSLLGKDRAKLLGIADRGQCLAHHHRGAGAQLFREIEDAAFVDIQKDEAAGLECRQHPAELGPDRARRAGDQHGLSPHQLGGRRDVDVALRASDQVVGGQLAQRGAGARREPTHGFGNDEDRQPRGDADREEVALLLRALAPQHEGHALRGGRLDPVPERARRADHRHAHYRPAHVTVGQAHDADRDPVRVGMLEQHLHGRVGAGVGDHDEHAVSGPGRR